MKKSAKLRVCLCVSVRIMGSCLRQWREGDSGVPRKEERGADLEELSFGW